MDDVWGSFVEVFWGGGGYVWGVGWRLLVKGV